MPISVVKLSPLFTSNLVSIRTNQTQTYLCNTTLFLFHNVLCWDQNKKIIKMFLRMFFYIIINLLMWSVWRQALVLFCGLINITLLVVTTLNEIKSIKPYWEPGPETGWNYTLLGIDIITKYTDPKLNRLPPIGNPLQRFFLAT